MITLHAIYQGRVQGVGFRWTVVECAEKFHLTGTVKNLANGNVEVYAQGTKESLEEFLELVKKNSESAHIDSVTCNYSSPIHSFTGFHILH